jgi:hypothetical protein
MRDDQITAVADGIAATGARAVRFDVAWSSVERVRGNPVWTHIDRIVEAFANRGIAMLGICTYAPAWANGGQPNTFPPLAAYYEDFATFCAAAARRYPQIRAWEVWNEPNLDQFWHDPNARDYVALLTSTYRALKEVDPDLTVVSGGLAPHGDYSLADDGGVNPRTFLEEMYAAGARGSMDAVGDHPYGTPASAAFRELGDTRPSIRSIMVRNGDGSKPIWATEAGKGLQPYEASGGAATETEQANDLRLITAQLCSRPYVGPIFWFTYADYVASGYGLVRSDWSARPAYAAFAAQLRTGGCTANSRTAASTLRVSAGGADIR